MKKPDAVQAPAAAGGLETVVARWRDGAAQEEAAVLAALHEQAAPAVAEAEAALGVYAEVARQHGARLRAEQTWLTDPVLGRSRWFADVGRVQERGREILHYLDANPPLIAKHLTEVAGMTVAYAASHRLAGVLLPALTGMADTAMQLAARIAGYDEGLALLKRRLEAEAPDLTPQVGLASAGLDAAPSSSRRAVSGLSDG